MKEHSRWGIQGHYENTEKGGQWLHAFHRDECLRSKKFSTAASITPLKVTEKAIKFYLDI